MSGVLEQLRRYPFGSFAKASFAWLPEQNNKILWVCEWWFLASSMPTRNQQKEPNRSCHYAETNLPNPKTQAAGGRVHDRRQRRPKSVEQVRRNAEKRKYVISISEKEETKDAEAKNSKEKVAYISVPSLSHWNFRLICFSTLVQPADLCCWNASGTAKPSIHENLVPVTYDGHQLSPNGFRVCQCHEFFADMTYLPPARACSGPANSALLFSINPCVRRCQKTIQTYCISGKYQG